MLKGWPTSILLFSLLGIPGLFAADWKPIDPAELSLKTPKIDPHADAEAIFWEVQVADQLQGGMPQTVFSHYLRVKVFTARGAETQSTIDLTTAGNANIRDLQGRTIKPDGRMIPLEKTSVFQRTIVKANDIKVKVKSFAMPGVEPGDIIEYKWMEYRDNELANYLRLHFQREIPVWFVKYSVKPLDIPGYQMQSLSFRCPHTGFKPEGIGFFSTTLSDVPAFREEPDMPPEDQVRSWVLLFYTNPTQLEPAKFWNKWGKEQAKEFKKDAKVDDAIKKEAARLTNDAATPADKLGRLVHFCLEEIKNIYHDRSGVTAEDRQDWKPNRKPSDTLQRKMGTSNDINHLFAALASAAGMESRVARVAGRNDIFFTKEFRDPYLLNRYNIAVLVEGDWRFFDLSSPYLAMGMLRWPEEAAEALVCDSDNPVFVTTPLTGPDQTAAKREATLRLSEDGVIEGEIRAVYTGHEGVVMKSLLDGMTSPERETYLKEELTNRLSTAEVKDIWVENVTDLDEPVSYGYKIKVPGYAQAVGKRIFLPASFFRLGIAPRFKTSERMHDVYFEYPWSESDTVTIEMPEGFALDNAEQPQSLKIANVGAYTVKLEVTAERTLRYERQFRFGDNATILFPANIYSHLKGVFDAVHEQDGKVLTLRQP